MSIEDHIIHMENGILHSDSPRPKIDTMIQTALDKNKPLVLHFHGGLVKYKTGREGAERLSTVYENAGAYPFFFIWESGLKETITNNLGEVSKEKIFRILWKRIRKIIIRKTLQVEGGRDVGDLPQPTNNSYEIEIDTALDNEDVTDLMKQPLTGSKPLTELSNKEISLLEAELAFDFELMTEVQNISGQLRDPNDIEDDFNSRSTTIRGSASTLMDPNALNQFVERPNASSRGLISMAKMIKNVVKIAAKVISRFIKGRDHGLHATIVEEILHALYIGNIGGIIWKTMKKDTLDSFGPDPDRHGGTAFIDALKSQTNGLSHFPRVILIGHSTGAVYISEFIKKADEMLKQNIKFDIIFLAPASTFRLTGETIKKYSHRINKLRMFTMKDSKEKEDQLVPFLYPHSLLYFVSGVVESEVDMPIVGMQRYFDKSKYPDSKFPAISAYRDYINNNPDSVVWSITDDAADGLNSSAIKHGDFDNDQTTLDSISHII